MLGHATGLYDDLTVADNVRFWARAVRARDVDAGAAMERLGLSGRLAGVLVGRLSAGQRRRTALACLVARRPELWLLDEPHAGLDAAGRDTIDEIVRAAAAAGATVLVASHELERAGGLADRRIVLSGGMVVHDEAVEAAPASAPAAPADAEAEAEVAPAVTCAS
jgi:ABC-type multidrug transport system ATPase subunit